MSHLLVGQRITRHTDKRGADSGISIVKMWQEIVPRPKSKAVFVLNPVDLCLYCNLKVKLECS